MVKLLGNIHKVEYLSLGINSSLFISRWPLAYDARVFFCPPFMRHDARA